MAAEKPMSYCVLRCHVNKGEINAPWSSEQVAWKLQDINVTWRKVSVWW